jgi:CCR4-NOT transcription complex subunit 1
MQPFLKAGTVSGGEPIRKLYKGTMRVLLVLLHDVPEFLSDYHLSFCDLIPMSCVQLRNLILSAFPRSMRLPDPFTPNLKVDALSDNAQAPPRILTDYSAPLASIKMHLDNYLTQRQPPELPSKLPTILLTNGAYNHALTTSLVVHVATVAISQIQAGKWTLATTPAMDIYKAMVTSLDAEGRYVVLNTIANQLRYPNSHTHFFSFCVLTLFADAENEYLQEQITRVLLERLIVHRPHPWGLLVTFIELIKNPRYGFWRKTFTRSAPEMERVFESIARSCLGPNYATIQQQQQAASPAV